MLISLHIPKSAGSSFLILLKNHFKDSLIKDNNDLPLHVPFEIAKKTAERFSEDLGYFKRLNYYVKGIKCIHGHFLISKYQRFRNNKKSIYITWLREPFDRMESHYNYWLRTFDNEKTTAPFHRKVVEENWSFEDFCFSEQMQNIYSKFLQGFPLDSFDFIGITEYFNEDTTYFLNTFLNVNEVDFPYVNVNPNKEFNHEYSDEFLKRFKSFHSKDYEIYNYAIRKRELRYFDK